MRSETVTKKFGMAPGALVYIGDQTTEPVTVSLMGYDENRLEERSDISVEACRTCLGTDAVTWINVSGIHDTALIEAFGRLFNLHPLLLEDILNTKTRPKLDDYDQYLFVVLKMIDVNPENYLLDHEQVSLVIGKNVIISFQERPGDIFDPVRDRIRKGKGRLRRSGADYLAYSLIDMIVDHYFKILEIMGEQIESLEEAVLEAPESSTLQTIHSCKHQMIFLRKAVWPVREIISTLVRDESSLIGKDVTIYLRDVHDHTIQVVDTVETYRDVLSGVFDIYLSNVSNRMNEVMKVLTIIATIFIPLTFIAGIYGMNFQYMPELQWHYAYPLLWMVFVIIAGGMLMLFRRKKWL